MAQAPKIAAANHPPRRDRGRWYDPDGNNRGNGSYFGMPEWSTGRSVSASKHVNVQHATRTRILYGDKQRYTRVS